MKKFSYFNKMVSFSAVGVEHSIRPKDILTARKSYDISKHVQGENFYSDSIPVKVRYFDERVNFAAVRVEPKSEQYIFAKH